MPSPGSPVPRTPADQLQAARSCERSGCIPEAIAWYEKAIALAEATGEGAVLSEALRRLAIVLNHRDQPAQARELCRRSYSVARKCRNDFLAAEACNTLGGLDLRGGLLPDARRNFLQALTLGGHVRELRARVEQNLGILANIQGELEEALDWYQRSLDAYREADDSQGCAIAFHNLGMVSADRERWEEAVGYFGASLDLAEQVGDLHLQGLCLVNHAEVLAAQQRFEDALRKAERALAIFDQLGARGTKADAYRVIGAIYRDTGRAALAESRLRSAMDLAASSGSVLSEAESARELALLHQANSRNQDALTLLNHAYRLFGRLEARKDLVNTARKVAELEGAYLAVVRAWGQSIESSDSYTFGHSERVARNAVAVARALGLDQLEETTIRLGAYLHDVGKVRVPHEILNKPGPLNRDETAVLQMHPIWGIELLADVEFPWDLKPIIRWHHEKYDGSGYPDHLRGDAIPISAQIVGIVDMYDALTTNRPYQPALPPAKAIRRIARFRRSWSDRVFTAFLAAIRLEADPPAGIRPPSPPPPRSAVA